MSLHETVLGGGRIKVYSRFKPGDVVISDDGNEGPYSIKEVFIEAVGSECYPSYRHCCGVSRIGRIDADFHLAPKPKTFLNIYDDDEPGQAWFTSHMTRELADKYISDGFATAPRIALVTIYDDLSITHEDTRGEQ